MLLFTKSDYRLCRVNLLFNEKVIILCFNWMESISSFDYLVV